MRLKPTRAWRLALDGWPLGAPRLSSSHQGPNTANCRPPKPSAITQCAAYETREAPTTTMANYGASNKFYASPEWKAQRAGVVERENDTCQACKRQGGSGNTAHHTYGISVDPDGNDLTLLCQPDHKLLESMVGRKSRLKVEMLRRVVELAFRKLQGPGHEVHVVLTVLVDGEALIG